MDRLLNIRNATKELNILRSLDGYKRPFEVVGTYRLIDDGIRPEATVKIRTEDSETHEASTGVGPVDALANVLKKSLTSIFPMIERIKLVDFSAKVNDARSGTSARVEVSIIFTDGKDIWSVQETAENINMASFLALVDGFEFAISLLEKSGG
ncbi:MAG TPA: alpha-isopropylmalate synthase regulatory domain-containing protein [Syntrophorhabdaceae bacterium]|nr:alpha-isopropylmalate synthase regulatory domain-containing protein [Syntrophorhabdaceae bacterium]HOL06561.1 alpha-isopropylmalate synthase regulatory domain-containing protein [Syntrophorhabdaceae bacterium]HON86501.1 alpha-isopropylmalate synthase regulatory domain-containing protein [Syntrophorhabdaceae bacterium]HOT43039.1 alpha-isopropylmalate synthase regulatory domain-containing protein [Syntrophorhabdaceae bacterium]HPC67698.1 alpha-isopropylmalate synthase regulatory domain-contain